MLVFFTLSRRIVIVRRSRYTAPTCSHRRGGMYGKSTPENHDAFLLGSPEPMTRADRRPPSLFTAPSGVSGLSKGLTITSAGVPRRGASTGSGVVPVGRRLGA